MRDNIRYLAKKPIGRTTLTLDLTEIEGVVIAPKIFGQRGSALYDFVWKKRVTRLQGKRKKSQQWGRGRIEFGTRKEKKKRKAKGF